MKMFWLGVLMLASFLLSFTGFIEADEDIPWDIDESQDIEHIDLPPPKYDEFSNRVLEAPPYDEEDGLLHHTGGDLEIAEHKRIEEEVMTHMKQVAEESYAIDGSEDTLHKPDQDLNVEIMEEGIDNDVHDGEHEEYEHDEYPIADDWEGIENPDFENMEMENVKIHDFGNKFPAEEEAYVHLKQVVDGAEYDVKEFVYEHVVSHDKAMEDEEELKMEEIDEDEIVEAEYVGRYVHEDPNDELSNADDMNLVRKRPTKITMDEALKDEQQALRKVGLLRRSDRGEVGKGDNPNKTTRVYLKHVQDHLKLEEAHAILEEGSDYVEKVEYRKPERPVVHKHRDNVKFVKHDEF